jgi:hypothetical protein
MQTFIRFAILAGLLTATGAAQATPWLKRSEAHAKLQGFVDAPTFKRLGRNRLAFSGLNTEISVRGIVHKTRSGRLVLKNLEYPQPPAGYEQ